MHRSIATLSCLLLVSAAGCTDLSSADLKTAGMSTTMSVTADGTGQTVVTAQFNVDDNGTDFVNLSSGDSAVAEVAGQSHPMSESNALGDISYQTTFVGEDQGGTQYTVALDRSSGNTSAPDSTCTLPSAFSVTSPTSSGTFSRTQNLTVTYSGGGTSDTMSWQLSGCSEASGTVTGDSGTFTIPSGTLSPGGQQSGTCQDTLTLTRSRAGQVDPSYGSGGSIVAQQVRSVTFNLTP